MAAPIAKPAQDPLVDIFSSRQLVPAAKLEAWLAAAEEEDEPIAAIVMREKGFSRPQLLHILENHFFCPSADVSELTAPADALALVSRDLAEHHAVVPIQLESDRLVVAVSDPSNDQVLDALGLTAHKKILPRVSVQADILGAIERSYEKMDKDLAESPPAQSRKVERPKVRKSKFRIDLASKETPIEVVDEIISAAARIGVTDIHVNPCENALKVRFRIDGILHTVGELPADRTLAVISRTKIMSNLDIAEHRVPQDGRSTYRGQGLTMDLRVSTLPAQFGENVVIRMLGKDANLLDLENLNMPPPIHELHQEMVNEPIGMFLVTGPTGSGKTTTLYATLNAHDQETTNIITLEDPIEYSLPGIVQVQINDSAGLTFASGLRSILRQDPEVVLVGEIRDLETVEIAARAALTGHKVLSTLHTNDAVQAVTRLVDMGTPPHLITATLKGVLAQRLIRVNCPDCREEYDANETEIALLGYPKDAKLARGTGCATCNHTGYKGRMPIFEYFKVEESIHRYILERSSPYVIRHAAQRNGMILMAEFAKKAVLDGKTTVGEITRVVFSGESREQLCQNCQRVVAMEFTICPFCQQVLKEACGKCGNALDASWEACPNCGTEVEREWQKVFCKSCLAPVDGRWTSCRYCGESLG